ncbi:MAG: hypothetical protein ABW146_05265 [Candidatus Sedimenticola sp. 6PFRAG7]
MKNIILLLLTISTLSISTVQAAYWGKGYSDPRSGAEAVCFERHNGKVYRVKEALNTPKLYHYTCQNNDGTQYYPTVRRLVKTCGTYPENSVYPDETGMCPEENTCKDQTDIRTLKGNSQGLAPGYVCFNNCRYSSQASASTSKGYLGVYQGEGAACQPGDGTGMEAPADENSKGECTDPQFPLSMPGSESTCLPAPGSPMQEDGCFEFMGERVCENDGDPACSVWEKEGLVCPDDNQNCVMKGGRIICPTQPRGENEPVPDEATCITIAGKETLCFKDGKMVESETTSVKTDADGTVTTTTTSYTNIVNTSTKTTTTVVNPDGSKTTTTKYKPTPKDVDGDGKPDDAKSKDQEGKESSEKWKPGEKGKFDTEEKKGEVEAAKERVSKLIDQIKAEAGSMWNFNGAQSNGLPCYTFTYDSKRYQACLDEYKKQLSQIASAILIASLMLSIYILIR